MAIFQVSLGYPVASFILRSDWCKTFWSQNARTDNDQKKYVLDLSLLHPLTPNGNDGWLVGWGLTALLTQNRSYRACRFV